MLKSIQARLSIALALLCSSALRAQPLNDDFRNRIPIEPSIPFPASLAAATLEPGDPLSLLNHPSKSVGTAWWSWTPAVTGFATIVDAKETFPASWSPALAVYEGDSLSALANANWTYMTPRYDGDKGGFQPFLGFRTVAGRPLSIGMIGNNSDTSQNNLFLTVSETPIIIEHPTSQTLPAGSAATFRFISPSFVGGRAQWQFNGADIPNATNAVLSLKFLRPSNAGEYRVIIDATNSAGIVKRTISTGATLAVIGDLIPPTVILERASSSPDTFELKIMGTSSHSYSVYGTADFARWELVPFEGRLETFRGTNRFEMSSTRRAEFLRVEYKGDLVQTCVQNLRQIHFAKEMLRVTHKILPGSNMNPVDAKQFLGGLPVCPQGATYWYGYFDSYPVCPVADHVEP